ncbi:hypothetical protein [Bacillus sp. CGMCC 1.16541]|uniref:hypothetical protein n=1 Tax=Bacillus sp. CGMCC 1.16541 TaxID=2185143 RepID=UPI000D73CDA9|nr:hypothetical protein [Bacillus sp. CGMCC 1.16541]
MNWLTMMTLIFALIMLPLTAAAEEPTTDEQSKLEEKVNETDNYFKSKSIKVLKKEQFIGEVTSGEEPFKTSITAYYLEYKTVRDSLFTFTVQKIFYYDEDNKAYLEESDIAENELLTQFIKNHPLAEKKRDLSTDLLITAYLLIGFSAPFVIGGFSTHRRHRTSSH